MSVMILALIGLTVVAALAVGLLLGWQLGR